jgi:phage gp37-like protein
LTHELATIEAAVLAALADLKTAGTIRTLDPYQEMASVEDLKALRAKFPAVYVFADGLDISPRNQVDEMRAAVVVLVADQNTRGGRAATAGDSESSGVYAILEAVRSRLHRRIIVAGWTELFCVSEGSIDIDLGSRVYLFGARYELRTPRYHQED